jgi:predicted O-methyltransferase YrrM
VFEDGPHVPEVTLAAFELVRDHVRPGGLYLVDDIYFPGNEDAWRAIRADSRVEGWAELNGRLGICALA